MAVLGQQQGEEIKLKGVSRGTSLFGVFLILIAVAVYSFYTSPLSDGLDAAKADISSKEVEIDSLKNRLETLQKAETDLELSTEVQRRDISKRIPPDLDQDEVIEDLIEISETYDIGLRSLSFGKGTSAQEGIGSLRVNASFEGSFSDLIDFLQAIERNDRFFRVNSISVQIAKLDISGILRATFSLSIEAFFREDPVS